MKDVLNNKMKSFIENGVFIKAGYCEGNESLRKRMNKNDYHFYIKTATNTFIFTTLTHEIEIPLKDFDWRMLWSRLGDIPTNEDDELEENFLHFEIGVDKMDVWHWFEWFFDISLGEEIFNK